MKRDTRLLPRLFVSCLLLLAAIPHLYLLIVRSQCPFLQSYRTEIILSCTVIRKVYYNKQQETVVPADTPYGHRNMNAYVLRTYWVQSHSGSEDKYVRYVDQPGMIANPALGQLNREIMYVFIPPVRAYHHAMILYLV